MPPIATVKSPPTALTGRMSAATAAARHMVAATAAARRCLIDWVRRDPPPIHPPEPAWSARRDAWGCLLQREVTGEQFLEMELDAMFCVRLTAEGLRLERRPAEWLCENAHPLCRDVLRHGLSVAAKGETRDRSEPPWPVVRETLDHFVRRTSAELPESADWFALYEHYLAQTDQGRRRRRGVYYTPRPLARYVVRRIDHVLREEFGLALGLADTSTWRQVADRCKQAPPAGVEPDEPFVTVLDPALGSGIFLVEVIECIHDRLTAKWRRSGLDAAECRERWNAFVPRHLLPRLFGLELMLPSLAAAHVQIAAQLAATGFRFDVPAPLRLLPADTLSDPIPQTAACSQWESVLGAERVRRERPFPVILGNPPFASLSRNTGNWIQSLLRGREGELERASYLEVEGRPLGERKHWLHDDYVKFLRYAHWQVERCGTGIVALVTNHGYLDNKTFRGLREKLLREFHRADFLDLHGNRKKHETAPGGGKDENVFGIDQGVAVSLLRRPPDKSPPRHLYRELWGTAESKLQRLSRDEASPSAACHLQPTAPEFLFVPAQDALDPAYEAAWPLPRVMPVHTTAPVTARDSLVVGWTREELVERMAVFRDLAIPDEWIREKFFPRRRSWRYPAGDTRGWKLAEARRRMAAGDDWQAALTRCLYRPFDIRAVYWADWMVDWPRGAVMRHVQSPNNRTLIARRQMLPGQECTYFWICDCLALDGVIRSDNRGSEALFPLYLAGDAVGGMGKEASDQPSARSKRDPADGPPRDEQGRPVNLDAGFLEDLCRLTGMVWRGRLGRRTEKDHGAASEPASSFGPHDVLGYIYALFHSPEYRGRYADALRRDFPGVLLPARAAVFRQLARLGTELAKLHLDGQDPRGAACGGPEPRRGQTDSSPLAVSPRESAPGDGSPTDGSPTDGSRSHDSPRVERRKIAWRDGAVWINDGCRVADVPEATWEFRVGGHQVCRKWLADRHGRRLSADDLRHYRRIVTTITSTRRWMSEVDRIIRAEAGGEWTAAFASGDRG